RLGGAVDLGERRACAGERARGFALVGEQRERLLGRGARGVGIARLEETRRILRERLRLARAVGDARNGGLPVGVLGRDAQRRLPRGERERQVAVGLELLRALDVHARALLGRLVLDLLALHLGVAQDLGGERTAGVARREFARPAQHVVVGLARE